MRRCNCHKPPRPIKPGPVETTPSTLYPDIGPYGGPLFPDIGPYGGPLFPVPPPPPVQPDPEVPPDPPGPPGPPVPCVDCPPRVYRNPPDVNVIAGEHVDVVTYDHIGYTNYVVSSKPWGVVIDPDNDDIMYGDGTKDSPLGIYDFDGATETSDGKPGTVPAPTIAERGMFLRGDGTWSEVELPANTQSDWAEDDPDSPSYIKNRPGTFSGATETMPGTSGFVPAPGVAEGGMFLRGDGTWSEVDNSRACTSAEMDAWISEVENGVDNG